MDSGSAPSSGDVVAGFVLGEVLAASPTSRVFRATGATGVVAANGGVTDEAVLKLVSNTQAPERENESLALARIRSDHVVRLIDVSSTDPRWSALVLEPLLGGSLATVLGDHSTLRAGEAVTILASIARALGDLRDIGFRYERELADSVLFDRAGRPVLVGLGHVARVDPSIGVISLNDSDVSRLRATAQRVLARADASGREGAFVAATEWLRSTTSGAGTDYFRVFEERMFAVAQPVPVRPRLRQQEGDPEDAQGMQRSAELDGNASIPVVFERDQSRRRSARREAVLRSLVDARPVAAAKAYLEKRAAGRRRQVVLAACLAAAIVAVCVVLIPTSPGRGDASRADSSSPPSPTAGRSATVSSSSSASTSAPSTRSLRPETASPVPSTAQESEYESSLMGDDPVAAAGALFLARQECLRQASLGCLEDTDDRSSPILAADQSSVAGMRANTRSATDGVDSGDGQINLIDRSGNSALVGITVTSTDPRSKAAERRKPASALLIKGEAGWRLREIFES